MANTPFSTALQRHEYGLTKYPSRSVNLLDRLMNNAHGDSGTTGTATSIGAGLGGLSAAIALARRGNQVTVFEQAGKIGEIGAGIQLPPNCTRFLRQWGVTSHFQDSVVEPEAITLRRWENGVPLGTTKLVPDFQFKFGSPYYLMHRADFHTALVKCARQLGVEIQTGSRVISYNSDANSASVQTADGLVVSADLIIAADGIKSLARSTILGGIPNPPLNTGFAAYRATVDTRLMRDHADLRGLFESPNISLWIGENRHVMTYCISGGKKLNMVLSHPENESNVGDIPGGSRLDMETTLAEMRKQFEGWDPV
ncbi:salicylate hydroxylase [Akanthomyces lecanii RCEF 1005]|uniref:Salicylate hydroxylase n=1 Tax=Akanthomyces lecanii RCEF 1005 TaxID=1081108 RepID=A0A168G786_CORDF|nr:salicylate hydroxylase [Akanthomyces lecanii RCEF 1005]